MARVFFLAASLEIPTEKGFSILRSKVPEDESSTLRHLDINDPKGEKVLECAWPSQVLVTWVVAYTYKSPVSAASLY